jgi:hypothetical protein
LIKETHTSLLLIDIVVDSIMDHEEQFAKRYDPGTAIVVALQDNDCTESATGKSSNPTTTNTTRL